MIKVFTIGYGRKSAEEFFDLLTKKGIKKLVDIRLNNTSQLAGFTKKTDLPYLLKTLHQIGYEHNLDLAPTQDILKAYKDKSIDWNEYENKFLELIRSRKIETKIKPESLNNACFLCSEPTAKKCHRRLVAEYLQKEWESKVQIEHL